MSTARFSVDKFIGNFTNPARGVKFECQITLGDISLAREGTVLSPFGSLPSPITHTCFSATLPEISVETGELNYFTRPVRYPGRRMFAPITLSFYNTEDYVLRRAFEQWNFLLVSPIDNLGFAERSRAADLSGVMVLTHYSEKDVPISLYEFRGIFPVTVGALNFNYNNDSEIQTFDVTFAYHTMFQRQP